MKANAIKSFAAFAVVLFMSSTVFAQNVQEPGMDEVVGGKYPGMTVPVDFVMPTGDPSIGALVEDNDKYGVYANPPLRSRTMEPIPDTGPKVMEADDAPNYWNVNISYYTDENGNEFSVKSIVDNGIEDKLPVVAHDTDADLLETQMAAWEELNAAEHE